MTTKYDWSKVPHKVNFIATDANGRKHGYVVETFLMILANCWHSFDKSIPLGFLDSDLNGCAIWENTLEQRPTGEPQ
ncbi:hypothetical protein [Acinetobacter sp. Ac_5812]|uniref:hypothetical protein n=1 Tax=Acinetobacter sp. Ac_5812 TaxID=1848937 RepID=UPI0014901EE8|nr:hypothetical protein [Acinetobacter sp. Ac_5812]NNP70960.1 hypothetical protein [Acinetobacter sp. Ac_5812]